MIYKNLNRVDVWWLYLNYKIIHFDTTDFIQNFVK